MTIKRFFSSVLLCCLMSMPAMATGIYDGIWVGEFPAGTTRYFSVVENNGKFLIVDLYEVAYFGDTLKGSYIGTYSNTAPSDPASVSISILVETDVKPSNRVWYKYSIIFWSETKATIGRPSTPFVYPLPPFNLTKIF